MSDELKQGEPTDKEETRLAYELRQQRKQNRELQERLEALEAKKHDEDLGIGDGSSEESRGLAREIRSLKQQLGEIQRQAFRTDEDVELEPYLERVLDENPELLKAYPTPGRRLEAARVMARGLKASESTNTRSSQGLDSKTTRVHLTGSGSSAPRRRSGEDDWAKFQEKMKAAKTSEERKQLADEWDANHPEG